MLSYKTVNKFNSSKLENITLLGSVGDQMELFFKERVTSDYAKEVIYRETEDAFRNQIDDKSVVGLWQGEFWGKWVISACRVAKYKNDAELREFLHNAALTLISLADADGYIGTYRDKYNVIPPSAAEAIAACGYDWTWNWNVWCRKYTLWGLLEIYDLTQDERILASCVRFTDDLINVLKVRGVSVRETGTLCGLPSSSVIKPVVILYRCTGEKRFLDFAIGIAEELDRDDGAAPNIIRNSLKNKPVHEWYPEPDKWAKAYEMMSCLDGLLELYRMTGEEKYFVSVKNLHALLRKHERNTIYSAGHNDMFGNAVKYINSLSEPCDIIHWMRLCSELYKLTGEADYVQDIEYAFLNPFLAGSFKDGKWGSRGVRSYGRHMYTHQAKMKYSHCCVNNMPRGYLNAAESYVAYNEDGVYINMFTDFEYKDEAVEIKLSGSYLANGRVELFVTAKNDARIFIRIPEHCKKVTLDGAELIADNGYSPVSVKKGYSKFALCFDLILKIADHEYPTPEYGKKDFPYDRFMIPVPVDEDMFITENRCRLLYGPLILAKSKLIGSTENEMFGGGFKVKSDFGVRLNAKDQDGIHQLFEVTFTDPEGSEYITDMCDFASASNVMSEEDRRIFTIYI